MWTSGEVLADGPSTDKGEIALGRNVLIGFMTWEGYNYEDAVLHQRTPGEGGRVHLHSHRGIRIRGPRHQAGAGGDHPRHSQRRRRRAAAIWTSSGIIRIGAEVRAGDILVGKVTPKGETELTAEERLLRAIFGEKAREVRDTSLRVPHGEVGIIVDVKIFTRENQRRA